MTTLNRQEYEPIEDEVESLLHSTRLRRGAQAASNTSNSTFMGTMHGFFSALASNAIPIAVVSMLITVITITTIAKTTEWYGSDDQVSTSNDDYYYSYVNSTDDANDTLRFSLFRNGYDPLDYFSPSGNSILKYQFLEEHAAIIEPYASMRLKIYDFPDFKDYTYKYTVCADDAKTSCQHGTLESSSTEKGVSFDCSPYETFLITLSEYESGASTARRTSKASAICMYVRREIQSLTSDDADAVMDAMYALWDYSEAEGQKKYGKNFHAAIYFISAHEFNSAQQDSDHMHEGVGFLPQHIKLSNMFEVAMQAVDPSVTLPYWDFTIDRAAGLNVFESAVFTEDMFGTLRKPDDQYWGWTYRNSSLEDAVIQDGRWANLKVEENTKYENLVNSFGTIRGLWTLNPSKYVSRFTTYNPTLPACSAHYSWLDIDDIGSFFYTANNAPHASTHGSIAATYGCDAMDDMRLAGYLADTDSQRNLCTQWGFILKDLYRDNYITARDDCSAKTYAKEDIDCGFICNEELYDDMPDFLESAFKSTWVPSTMTNKGWEAWRDFICEGDGYLVFFGDHLDPSVSPSDPSFWPLHPTLERVLHAKYMSGGFENDEWPSDPVNDYVCSLAECYEDGVKDYHDQCCYGHYEDDQLMDFVNGNTSQGFGPTNKELISSLNPTDSSYSLTYIYDNFFWDHCDEDFEALIEEKYEQRRRRRRL